MATPNYTVNPDDERFAEAAAPLEDQEQLIDKTYGDMIGSSDQFYQDLKDQTQTWEAKQTEIQNQQTDFAIERINQQKDQAEKDYKKEQSGAYVDWRKQSNEYGVEAEKMAAAGLANTGYSESSQVGMYNTYQNRVSAAREAFGRAVLNYDNAIKDAQMQNSAALAEIANNALQKQLELSIEGFQYKNQLIDTFVTKKTELEQLKWQRYQDVLQQINTENAMKEEARQFESTQAFTAEQNRIKRDFEEKENQLDRDHAMALQEAKTKADKEAADLAYQRQKEILAQEHANDIALLKEQYSGGIDYSNGQQNGSLGSFNGKPYSLFDPNLRNALQTIGGQTYFFTGTTYKDAADFLRKHGYRPDGMMTDTEWRIKKKQYEQTGTGSADVTKFSSYPEYLKGKIAYIVAEEK